MFISSYTANLAAMFVNTPADMNVISSVEDCIKRDCNFCAHKHRRAFLQTAYPNLKNIIYFRRTHYLMDEMEEFGTGMRGYGSNTGYYFADTEKSMEYNNKPPQEQKVCDTYMLSSLEFKDKFRPTLCEYEFKGPPIYWLPISFPVSNKYSAALSSGIRRIEETNPFTKIRERYFKDSKRGEPTCDPFAQSDVLIALDQSTPKQLDWHHFAGPWLMLICATIFSLGHKLMVEMKFVNVRKTLLTAGNTIGTSGAALGRKTGVSNVVKKMAAMGSFDGNGLDMEMIDNPAISSDDSRDIRSDSAATFSFDGVS